ncbi:MAG: hypothetical protein ACOZAA_18470 [Pseudomonadota bacterium]
MRTILTAILAVAFVGYGMTANAPAHAHGAHEFHAVHAIAFDAHHDGHDELTAAMSDHDDSDDFSGADHHETGLHSHSVSQFSEADAPSFAISLALASRTTLTYLDSLPAMRRAAPPFKPPRAVL